MVIYQNLVANSLKAAICSIEIYNKPDLEYREQIFVVSNINAWELLLKAKILKDNNDNLSSLYVILPGGSHKTNRSGNPMTIEILGAIRKLCLSQAIVENLTQLIGIRDTVIHFYNDEALSYLVYTLGVASLKNFQKLMNEWFNKSLLEYNFYILPLGFAYNFKTLSTLEFENKDEHIKNLINSVSKTEQDIENKDGYHFICEVSTKLVSAKKLTDKADFVTAIDTGINADTLIIERLQRLTDVYMFAYKEVFEKVKSAIPSVTPEQFNKIIREHKVKENTKLSSYNFRTKSQQENFEKTGVLPKGIPSIYSLDAVQYIIGVLGG